MLQLLRGTINKSYRVLFVSQSGDNDAQIFVVFDSAGGTESE